MRTVHLGLVFTALLAGCAAANAQPAPPAPAWAHVPADFASLEEVSAAAAQFPNSSNMQRRRLGAALPAKDAATALDAARHMAVMGATLSPASRALVAVLVGADAMTPVSARFDANAAPLVASKVYASIPADHHLIEGIVWNGDEHRLYTASVVDRRLLAIDPPAAATVAAEGDFGSLFGGVYDAAHQRIWLASASIEQTPKNVPVFSGLVGIDLHGSSKPIRIPFPAGVDATLGDVALARDGTLYASDGLKGGIYRCRPGCVTLETFVAPGILFSAQGMALSRDQRWLYAADYRNGLAAVERSSGRVVRIAGDETMMLDGIDGLVIHGDSLIAVQNGVGPLRIVRLHLSPDGLRITRLDVLERANPDWGEPTLGTVAGNQFLYVADPQWDRYGEGGAAAANMPARPTPIRAIHLD
jgi:sugar lactone lactonase YvrE